jgi:hypothetical protein
MVNKQKIAITIWQLIEFEKLTTFISHFSRFFTFFVISNLVFLQQQLTTLNSNLKVS